MLTHAEAEAFAKVWADTGLSAGVASDVARKLGIHDSTMWQWRRQAQKLLGRTLPPLAEKSAGGIRRGIKRRGLVNAFAQATNPATLPAAGVANGEQPRTFTDTSPRDKPRRHVVIPDLQVRDGTPTDHLVWVGKEIAKRRPDVLTLIGDVWDMRCLSSYDDPGSLAREGARYEKDIQAGMNGLRIMMEPVLAEMAATGWAPDLEFTEGNHEDRIRRQIESDPRWAGTIRPQDCNVEHFGFRRHPFLKPFETDGVWYCHYFQNEKTSKPIGGTLDNRLNKICATFVVGHEQGLLMHRRPLPIGRTIHAIVAGSCYLHAEGYRGAQRNNEWRGIVVLNDVRDGDFDPMTLSLRYLCRTHTGMELVPYMQSKYPGQDWSYLDK